MPTIPGTFAALVSAALWFGAPPAPAQSAEADDSGEALERALQAMLTERESDEALQARIDRARELGATRQAVLEARFLYHVDRREDEKLAALLPRLVEQNARFELSESEIFAFEEDWLAILEYVRAIDALNREDGAGFKKHITEAFWLSPQQGGAYAGHIEKFRLDQAMRDLRIDFRRPLTSLHGETVELAGVIQDKPGLLLHFFSPWSRESAETLDEFAATARALEQAGIPVATILGETGPEAVTDTRELLRERADPVPGAWLKDAAEFSLNSRLRVQSAPTMVLVSADGRVLFNGHPAEPGLWEQIRSLAPSFERPGLPDQEDAPGN
jgi:hypothetical protein